MFSSTIGLIHTLFAFAAMLFGALVVFVTKGGQKHKILGYLYFVSMVIMNVTALFTHAIYRFGPFHAFAIASLILVCCGVAMPMFFRHRCSWLRLHYDLMLWSYVGLLAAFISEIAVRSPFIKGVIGGGTLFWILVILASLFTFLVGGYLITSKRKDYVRTELY